MKSELARLPGAPPVDLMRLREKSPMGNLTKVYYDSRTLAENVEGGMRDGRNIILQRTMCKEILSPEHVLLNLRSATKTFPLFRSEKRKKSYIHSYIFEGGGIRNKKFWMLRLNSLSCKPAPSHN